MVIFIECTPKKDTPSKYEIEKQRIESICKKYEAKPLDDLSTELIIPNLKTWEVQVKSKNNIYVFKTDFFTSLVNRKDSLFLIHKSLNTITEINIPKSIEAISEDDYIIFKTISCDALMDCENMKFFIKGTIMDVVK
jgi:hypothetical protein